MHHTWHSYHIEYMQHNQTSNFSNITFWNNLCCRWGLHSTNGRPYSALVTTLQCARCTASASEPLPTPVYPRIITCHVAPMSTCLLPALQIQCSTAHFSIAKLRCHATLFCVIQWRWSLNVVLHLFPTRKDHMVGSTLS